MDKIHFPLGNIAAAVGMPSHTLVLGTVDSLVVANCSGIVHAARVVDDLLVGCYRLHGWADWVVDTDYVDGYYAKYHLLGFSQNGVLNETLPVGHHNELSLSNQAKKLTVSRLAILFSCFYVVIDFEKFGYENLQRFLDSQLSYIQFTLF